ncbi:hypothetical protein BJ165DRAFT_1596510 [Panaeolus papilionaceus]|nr:hypothetical protein BJ165DRAFT_1596510 [Panaeolus papilionaceus]
MHPKLFVSPIAQQVATPMPSTSQYPLTLPMMGKLARFHHSTRLTCFPTKVVSLILQVVFSNASPVPSLVNLSPETDQIATPTAQYNLFRRDIPSTGDLAPSFSQQLQPWDISWRNWLPYVIQLLIILAILACGKWAETRIRAIQSGSRALPIPKLPSFPRFKVSQETLLQRIRRPSWSAFSSSR